MKNEEQHDGTQNASQGVDEKPKIKIVVVHEDLNCAVIVKPNTPLGKIFAAAEKKFGKEPGTFKFRYGDDRLQPEQTPADLDMEDGDQIDAYLEQLGG